MDNSIDISRGCLEISKDANQPRCEKCNCGKLDVCDWLDDYPKSANETDIVEIRFKNTRKGYFRNVNKLNLKKGDIVAVEASPGHDIGIVTLTGNLVLLQLKKNNIDPQTCELKKIYRKAKPVDIEKWKNAIAQEETVMLKARKIAEDLNLNMKIGDVEFQGDRTKAIFYYIADERVDFRELIKVLADEFKIRVEMRQIGARQEAGRIGGIGTCGRELCCSTWITNFSSVTTNAARVQELSLNPLKLAGQCGKLKCCLNYELDCYLDAQKGFPSTNIVLDTEEGYAYHQKTDIFKGIMWYSFDKDGGMNMTSITVDRVKRIIETNRRGRKVKTLINIEEAIDEKLPDFENVVGQESLTRFDDKQKRKGKSRRKKRRKKTGKRNKSHPKNRNDSR